MPRNFFFFILLLITLNSCHTRRAVVSGRGSAQLKLSDLDIDRGLRKEVEKWMGTPYRYGGNTRKGVDCSGFVNAVFLAVYEMKLPRTSKEMHLKSKKIKLNRIREGDLVFFNYEGRGVSHVGIYLDKNIYVHASTSKGVVLSNMDNEYSRKRYVGAGRFSK